MCILGLRTCSCITSVLARQSVQSSASPHQEKGGPVIVLSLMGMQSRRTPPQLLCQDAVAALMISACLIRLLSGHSLPSPVWPPHCLAICPLAFSLSSAYSTIAWKWPLPLSFTAWDSLPRQSEDASFAKYPPDRHGQGGGGPRPLEVKGFDQGYFELWCWRRLLRVPWTARISN